MPKNNLPLLLASLLGLLLALLLTACGTERVRLALPPADRATSIAFPAVPQGEALCDGAPCLSDRQTALLIADLAKALDLANGKLDWLHDWIVTAGKPRKVER